MITEQEVLDAQKGWGEGIVKIGKVFTDKGDYKAAATEHINNFYNYQEGSVLFKPTLAAEKQFRTDFEGALSYFVGGNDKFGEDGGFAIKPWTNVRWESTGVKIIGNMDGLLIDSEPYWQDAEIKVFGDIGFELTREMCKQTTGLRIDEVVEHYYRSVGWEKEKFPLQEVAENIVDEVISAVRREGKPLPGVEKTIHFFVEMRLPMALASSSNMGS